MIKPAEILKLISKAFWNIDMNRLDYTSQANYIIRKVFECGSWDDILKITVFTV